MEMTVTECRGFTVVKLSGKIDWESARELDKEIPTIIENGTHHIVFNLDEVSFMCSGGIGALVYNLNKIKKLGGAIYLISSNEYVDFIFDTLKFNIVFDGYLFKTYEQFEESVLAAGKIS